MPRRPEAPKSVVHRPWNKVGVVLAFALALVVQSCAAPAPPPPPPPTIVQLTISATPGINPNGSGVGTPVAVSVYQLAADNTFLSSDFFQLYGKETAVLGKDLLDKGGVTMMPGTTQTLTITGKPDVKILGVVAAFRNIDAAHWRVDIPVPPNATTAMTIKLDGLGVTIAPN